ncbi:unnamed protein product [Calypogeia fissa]
MTKMFKLRVFHAPMQDARTAKKYRELRLVPGRVYTFGRSRSCCNVVFSDGRVSRQHCQVYWDSITNQLLVFEGAPVDILIRRGNVNSSSSVLATQSKIKPSRNGLYVDGKKLAQGGCQTLNPGSEVSLVACTKGAKTVEDPGFGDAVGFFVQVVDLSQVQALCPVNLPKPVHIEMKVLGNKKSEKGFIPLPINCKKRPLDICKQVASRATEEKSSLSFERRSSVSSTARVKKKPKRSTAEIMGLLKPQQQHRQQASSGLMKIHEQRLDEGYKVFRKQLLNQCIENCRPLQRNCDSVQLRGEFSAKFSSKEGLTRQDRKTLLNGLSRGRVIDGEAITAAPERISLPKDNDIDVSRKGPNVELATKPEAEFSKVMAENNSHRAGHKMDQSCPRGEREEHQCTLDDLGRDEMGLAKGNMSNADAGVSNGKYSGSGFLVNRLEDMKTDSKVPSQKTVCLQELLNPTDGLLGIFAATFTSDIIWFLSSHNMSPALPVTVVCHDHDRCWSTAEESRTSSPFPNWPNVNVVYPVFPDSCCFATEKRQGIGCHHPKFFLLPRKDSIRVIVTSANLTRSQWLHVTNSVWWQDFPRMDSRDYEALFCTSGIDETVLAPKHPQSDFAVHLSSFVASLVADVPSAAHWALDLAEFDFSNAAASLVTSIPGLYGCPCPPVPASVRDLVNNDLLNTDNGVQRTRKFLAAVNSTVVGLSHRFKDSADPYGKRLRILAAILKNTNLQEDGMFKVQLERVTNLKADSNAVSVIVTSEAIQGGMEMVNGKDPLQVAGDSLSSSIPTNSVHIGFLPRSVAKWVAPLNDTGLCTFAAFIQPNELISVANGLSTKVAQLVLYVFEGREFSSLSTRDLTLHHTVALCGLLRNMERPLGLWRLHQILSKFNWPDALETSFLYGSSSIGTSLDAAFLAAFSVASGKKAIRSDLSQESDSQWGAWTVEQEANNPSIGVVFPTIERVKAAKGGLFSHQTVLCFAESTWERLKTACLLYDAIPFPAEREGIPMHVKVAQRRFQRHPKEAPYGWVYCGSHNFSPAAWGRPHAKAVHPCKCRKTTLGCTLLISNYEVGLVFVEPPPTEGPKKLQFKPLAQNPNLDESKVESDVHDRRLGLDKFVLPFCVPAPKYVEADQPATKRAMHNISESLRSKLPCQESDTSEVSDMEIASSEADEEGDESQLCLESAASQLEEEYGGVLWSQIDPFMPQ